MDTARRLPSGLAELLSRVRMNIPQRKVLLANLPVGTEEALRSRGIEADSAEIGDLEYDYEQQGYTLVGTPKVASSIPAATYEYEAAFVRLTLANTSESILPHFFQNPGFAELSDSFLGLWARRKRFLVLFIDACNYRDLCLFKVDGVKLEVAEMNDSTVDCEVAAGRPLADVLHEIRAMLTMPPAMYIDWDEAWFRHEKGNCFLETVYRNANGKRMGIMGCHNTKGEDPAFLVIPPCTSYDRVIWKLMKALAGIYPETYGGFIKFEWLERAEYYPGEVQKLEGELAGMRATHQEHEDALMDRLEAARSQYAYVSRALIASGQELKEIVLKVFCDIWGVAGEDRDGLPTSRLLREDIVLRAEGTVFVGEVKGVTQSSPSPKFITQAIDNCRKFREPGAIPLLILNHDQDIDPARRSIPYPDEDLGAITFLDIRDFVKLTLAIVDARITSRAAIVLMKGKGRIQLP